MTLDNEWNTTSGLPLDGATVTVKEMEFGYNAQVGAGVVCANFTFVDEEDTEIEQSFSVGKQGEPSRDGSELVGLSGLFSGRSNYGRLVESVRALVEHPGEVIGSPKQAAGWIGTKWTCGTVPVETTNPNTDEKKTKDAIVFTEFHGKVGSSKTAKADGGTAKKTSAAAAKRAAAKAAAAAEDDEPDDEPEEEAPAKAEAKSSDAPDGVDEALWKKLVRMARAADSHDEFSDEALELPEVDADRKIQKLVLSTRDGSVWAAVHGDD